MSLAQVRDLLGHASITTTEQCDNQKLENLLIAAAKLESGLTFEPPARSPDTNAAPVARRYQRSARTEFQESFKYEGAELRSPTVRDAPAIEPNELESLNLADWLGVRDDFRQLAHARGVSGRCVHVVLRSGRTFGRDPRLTRATVPASLTVSARSARGSVPPPRAGVRSRCWSMSPPSCATYDRRRIATCACCLRLVELGRKYVWSKSQSTEKHSEPARHSNRDRFDGCNVNRC